MMKMINIDGVVGPVSKLILGTAEYKPQTLEMDSGLLDEFLKIGGTTLDTAENYGAGESERALGMWMKERNNRTRLVLISKGAHPYEEKKRVNPHSIIEDLEGSLERLDTDYLDMYLLHRDDPSVPVGPIIEVLNEQISQGIIHSIGASNWTVERIQEANHYAQAKGLIGFSCSSTNLSLAKQKEPMWEDCVSASPDTCEWHLQNRFPLLSWSSQAGGFFSGRFTPDNRDNLDMVRVYYSDDNWERFTRARELAHKKGVMAIHIALAYVLNQPFPSCGIVGPRSIDEFRSSVEAMNIQLDIEELAYLDLQVL
jgi:aryl-alcohol dehydrogenase-like predicted oxidoreductase